MNQKQTELCGLMREYADFLETVMTQEQEKLTALLKADPEQLERALAKQQASQKQLENLEKGRTRLMCENEAGDKTLAEFIETLPAEERRGMHTVLKRLRDTASEIRFLNAKALGIVQMNLKSISLEEELAGEETGYTQDRKHSETEKTNAALFSAKV
ncbi:MAG: hypothetical protein Q4G07_00915 [Oscillospiraceae bacterium]|nr:hypothetical protein [Oscillospiraceae bacterium]